MYKYLSAKFALSLLCLLFTTRVFAGHFFKDDDEFFLSNLQQKEYKLDPSAAAIILYEKCLVEIKEGKQICQVRKIIKINNKAGVSLGDVSINVPSSKNNPADIRKIRAVTYRLANGKLSAQAIDDNLVNKKKTDYFLIAKFSLPSVSEGSIIDYRYTVENAPQLMFADWAFQNEIPKLWSELEIFVPTTLDFNVVTQGFSGFKNFDDSRKNLTMENLPQTYTTEETDNNIGVLNKRWVRRDVSAAINEPFIANIENYTERLQLQIYGVHQSAFYRNLIDTWGKLDTSLLNSFSYYQPVAAHQPKVKEQVDELLKGTTDELEKAKTLYKFVRNRISLLGYSSIWLSKSMDKILSDRSGTASDMNLLLTTMMRYAGIETQPVVLGTTDHLRPYEKFPTLQRFNRSICMVKIDSKQYFLDASCPYMPFGILPAECYNGYARIVCGKGQGVDISATMVKEKALVSFTTENASPGDYRVKGTIYFTNWQSADLRKNWRKDTALIKSYIVNQFKGNKTSVVLISYSYDNLKEETPLKLEFTVKLPMEGKELIYLNPLFISFFKENPFKSEHRTYPVEMPAQIDYTYSLQLKIPDGYVVEETPKPVIVTLDNKANYKYQLELDKESGMLSLRARVQITESSFNVDEYTLVKTYYDKVLESQQNVCVLKKKS